MNDEHDGIDRDSSRPESGAGPRDVRGARRPYAPPELVEYGTVAKLTQTGGGSVMDFGSMTGMMMTCL